MKIPQYIKGLIFDMDGTLVDSEPVGPATFEQLAGKYQTTPSDGEMAEFLQSWKRIGNYRDEKDVLSDFCVGHQLSISPEDFVSEFFETYKANLTNAHALTGVDDFLTSAKARGYKMAIVSASKKAQISIVLENHGWSEIFDYIIGEEDIVAHKPDPDGYNKAVASFGFLPSECAVFEDAKNGVLAARKAGAYVVGLREGNTDVIDLSNADVVLQDFSELSF